MKSESAERGSDVDNKICFLVPVIFAAPAVVQVLGNEIAPFEQQNMLFGSSDFRGDVRGAGFRN